MGLQHFLTNRWRAHTACAMLGIIFSVSGSMNALLSLLEKHVSYGTWATPLLYLSSKGYGLRSSTAAQHKLLCAGKCWEWPSGHGGLTQATETNLALALLYVSKALFHLVFDYVVFFGDSNTKVPCAQVFRALLQDW